MAKKKNEELAVIDTRSRLLTRKEEIEIINKVQEEFGDAALVDILETEAWVARVVPLSLIKDIKKLRRDVRGGQREGRKKAKILQKEVDLLLDERREELRKSKRRALTKRIEELRDEIAPIRRRVDRVIRQMHGVVEKDIKKQLVASKYKFCCRCLVVTDNFRGVALVSQVLGFMDMSFTEWPAGELFTYVKERREVEKAKRKRVNGQEHGRRTRESSDLDDSFY